MHVKKSSPTKKTHLVFDVGGTNLRAAIYDSGTGWLTSIKRCLTPSHWNQPQLNVENIKDALLNTMFSMAEEVLANHSVRSICIAYPGPVDFDGNALASPTLLGHNPIHPFPIRRKCTEVWLDIDVHVLNDLTAAGYWYVNKGSRDFCILTVSSGIGQKIFYQGHPLLGPNGRGGEIGHLVIDHSQDAPFCECGGKGHLGAIASGRGVLIAAQQAAVSELQDFRESLLGKSCNANPDKINNELLAKAFIEGDQWTRNVITCTSRPLAHAIAAIHLSNGVERFIIIGGFAKALGEAYRLMIVDEALNSCWALGQHWDDMIQLGDSSEEECLLGAGIYASTCEHDNRESRGSTAKYQIERDQSCAV